MPQNDVRGGRGMVKKAFFQHNTAFFSSCRGHMENTVFFTFSVGYINFIGASGPCGEASSRAKTERNGAFLILFYFCPSNGKILIFLLLGYILMSKTFLSTSSFSCRRKKKISEKLTSCVRACVTQNQPLSVY